MVGIVSKNKLKLRECVAPLLAAAALFSAGCVAEERERFSVAPEHGQTLRSPGADGDKPLSAGGDPSREQHRPGAGADANRLAPAKEPGMEAEAMTNVQSGAGAGSGYGRAASQPVGIAPSESDNITYGGYGSANAAPHDGNPSSAEASVNGANGSAATSGNAAYGSATTFGNVVYGSAATSGNVVYGSAATSGNVVYGSAATSDNAAHGSAATSGNAAHGSAATSGNAAHGSAATPIDGAHGSAATSGNAAHGSAATPIDGAHGSAATSGNAVHGSAATPIDGAHGSATTPVNGVQGSAATQPTAPVKPQRAKFSIPVLNYHSIGVEPDNNAVLDPRKLDEQMAYLADQGYTALTLRQFIGIWDGAANVPAKPVLLTFDDGYTDNYTEALPILQKYGFTATLFVSPGMVGQDGYFADWEQLRALRDAGWDIQPHGMTHPYLHKLTAEEQRSEIAESIRLVKEQMGVDTEVFCYPYGMRNKDTLKLLEEHGVRFAFTIDQGRTEPTQHPLLLKRLFVGGKESMDTFKKKLK
ncbi:polysaccharide deacetylase family protein [Paenibacillus hodogayensis]|uniref:Polysaccharide deacetylase family protein n=1 Tax=Paenibacillus hodogayensis TaxID=279208 RepID=A0ABV5VR24_9BACL